MKNDIRDYLNLIEEKNNEAVFERIIFEKKPLNEEIISEGIIDQAKQAASNLSNKTLKILKGTGVAGIAILALMATVGNDAEANSGEERLQHVIDTIYHLENDNTDQINKSDIDRAQETINKLNKAMAKRGEGTLNGIDKIYSAMEKLANRNDDLYWPGDNTQDNTRDKSSDDEKDTKKNTTNANDKPQKVVNSFFDKFGDQLDMEKPNDLTTIFKLKSAISKINSNISNDKLVLPKMADAVNGDKGAQKEMINSINKVSQYF